MEEIGLKRDYLVYTCETEKFDGGLYFPLFDGSGYFVRWALWFFFVFGSFTLLLRFNNVALWVVYYGVIISFVAAYFYYAQLRARWLREGIVYEVTNKSVRSMTHSGKQLGRCHYKNKSIKIIPLKNGYSEVHIRSKRIESGTCLNLFSPPDIGQTPCVFVMYQMNNAGYFVSLMAEKDSAVVSD